MENSYLKADGGEVKLLATIVRRESMKVKIVYERGIMATVRNSFESVAELGSCLHKMSLIISRDRGNLAAV